eukprot:1177035-Prorocentrum_minimum.AAC.1
MLSPPQEHIDRMNAARLQCDIMGTNTVLISRTDAEAANLIDSNWDPRDQPFILGTCNTNLAPMADLYENLDKYETDADINEAQNQWVKDAHLCTYYGVCVCVCCVMVATNSQLRDPYRPTCPARCTHRSPAARPGGGYSFVFFSPSNSLVRISCCYALFDPDDLNANCVGDDAVSFCIRPYNTNIWGLELVVGQAAHPRRILHPPGNNRDERRRAGKGDTQDPQTHRSCDGDTARKQCDRVHASLSASTCRNSQNHLPTIRLVTCNTAFLGHVLVILMPPGATSCRACRM